MGCRNMLKHFLQNKFAKIYITRNHVYGENFQAEFLYVYPKHGFGHTHKVSAWNFDKKYDFCNTQISREYFGELVKR